MNKAKKAALYSAFIFPGVGLLWLKLYVRAALFIVPSLFALSYLSAILHGAIAPVYVKFKRDIDDQVLIIDPSNIQEIAFTLSQDIFHNLASHMDQLNSAKMILIAAWLCSIVSSYFSGRNIESKENTDAIKP